MRSRSPRPGFWLRWYPRAWRSRYGAELEALVEDTLEGRRPTTRFRMSMARAGLRERAHAAVTVCSAESGAARVRTGSLLVLWAWVPLVVGGIQFAKLSEHFDMAVPASAKAMAGAAYAVVVAGALVGAAVLAGGLVLALPAFVAFLRGGGWPAVRAHVLRAVAATAAAGLSLAALVIVAHGLSPAQRNGGLLSHSVVGYYQGLFLLTGALVVVALVSCTAAATVAVRSAGLSGPVLAAEATLALVAAGLVLVVTGATALWWSVVARSAPWFLTGAHDRSAVSPFGPTITVTVVLMVGATALALAGVWRTFGAWSRGRTG
jgi:hypothetical protein